MKAKMQNGSVALDLSRDEFYLIRSALSEICYGPYAIEDWEFHTLTGFEPSEAKALADELNKVADRFKASEGS
jgi:hypothetical protein